LAGAAEAPEGGHRSSSAVFTRCDPEPQRPPPGARLPQRRQSRACSEACWAVGILALPAPGRAASATEGVHPRGLWRAEGLQPAWLIVPTEIGGAAPGRAWQPRGSGDPDRAL